MTYKNIQGLRGIAALMVLIAHVFYPLEPLRYHWAVPYVDAIGPAGVDVFFVISGFIIYTVAARTGASPDMGRLRAAYEFGVKRAVRIYPIYWIVFGAAFLVSPYVELAPSFLEQKQLLGLLTLTAQPNVYVQSSWTLTFEVYFYAAMLLVLFLLPRSIFAGALLWFGGIAAINIAAFAIHTDWMLRVPFASILFEFMFGMFVAGLAKRKNAGFALGSVLLGVAFFLIGAQVYRTHGGWATLPSWWRMGCFGIPSAFILYGFVAFEVRGAWTIPVLWQKLGDMSYSLYLWHQIAFAVLASLFVHWGWVGANTATPLGIVMLATALVIGWVSYHYIERPILQWLGGILLTRHPRNQVLASTATL